MTVDIRTAVKIRIFKVQHSGLGPMTGYFVIFRGFIHRHADYWIAPQITKQFLKLLDSFLNWWLVPQIVGQCLWLSDSSPNCWIVP